MYTTTARCLNFEHVTHKNEQNDKIVTFSYYFQSLKIFSHHLILRNARKKIKQENPFILTVPFKFLADDILKLFFLLIQEIRHFMQIVCCELHEIMSYFL